MKNSLLMVVTLFTIASCKKEKWNFSDISQSDLHPDIALPLINSSLSIDNLISGAGMEGYVTNDSDGLVKLIYEENILSLTAADLIQLNNQSFSYSLTLPANIVYNYNQLPAGQSIQYTVKIPMPVEWTTAYGIHIDSLLIKSGMLACNLSSSFPVKGTANAELEGVSKDAQPLSLEMDLQQNGPTTIDLANVSVASGNTGADAIQMNMLCTLIKEANVDLSASASIDFLFSMSDLKFQAIYGSFDQLSIPVPQDSLVLNLFNSAYSGLLSLTDPELTFEISNSFGLTLSAIDFQLTAANESGSVISLAGIPSPLIIKSPGPGGTVPALTSIELNNQNSNLANIISLFPNELQYSLTAQVAPGGAEGYVTDTSGIAVKLHLELPLSGTAGDFSLQDTFDFTMPTAIDEVASAVLRITGTNGFPIDAGIQVFFANAQSEIIDSLFTESDDNLFAAAATDPSGVVIQPAQTVTEVHMDATRWNHLYESGVNKIIVRGNLSSGNDGDIVKLYKQYTLNIQAGLEVVLNP